MLSRLPCAVCAPVKTNRGELLLNLAELEGVANERAGESKRLPNQRRAPTRVFRKVGGARAAGEPGTPAAEVRDLTRKAPGLLQGRYRPTVSPVRSRRYACRQVTKSVR
jgi:hypothetical protein